VKILSFIALIVGVPPNGTLITSLRPKQSIPTNQSIGLHKAGITKEGKHNRADAGCMQLINRFNYDTINRVFPGMFVPICDRSNEISPVFRSSPAPVDGVAAAQILEDFLPKR
jgi:hypothetical protein